MLGAILADVLTAVAVDAMRDAEIEAKETARLSENLLVQEMFLPLSPEEHAMVCMFTCAALIYGC
jgi:hypothetical protein